MKKISTFFFVTVLMILTSSTVFAQYLDENFEYPAGELISNYGWVPISGIGINEIHACEPGLEFECYGCIFGNAACMTTTGEDVYKFLTRKIDNGTLYTSFLVNFQNGQTGDFFFHLSDSTVNNSEKIARVYAKLSGGNIALGLAKENDDPVYTPAQYLLNTTYLVVLKYDFVPGGNNNDVVSLFVYSECAPQVEPAPTIGPLGAGEDDLTNAGKVVLQQGANSKSATLKIDGFCMFPTWDNIALPVELSSFTSNVSGRDAILNWTTASELNNSGFEIERASSDENWSKVAFVNGNGTSTSQNNYTFTDRNLSSGKFNYRLKQIDFNGNFEYFNLSSEVEIGIPSKFDLKQNYPNPFNPSTKITYDLANDGFVSIKIFDNLGREAMTIVNEFKTAGYYTVDFNALNLTSGLYFYKMDVNGFSKVMKMTLVK